jgi:phenylacetate-CoA ligase
MDEATVLVEAAESIFFDQMRRQREMVDRIEKRLLQELGISVQVKLVEKKTLERSDGKAKRVVDDRKLWTSPHGWDTVSDRSSPA